MLFLMAGKAMSADKIVRGRVAEIMSDELVTTIDDYDIRRQDILVRLGDGAVVNICVDYSPQKREEAPPAKGDRVFLLKTEDAYSFYGFDRTFPLTALLILFLAVTLTVGRWKGFRSLAALALTVFIMIRLFIPMVIRGVSVIPLTVLFAVAVTVSTLLIINGVSLKTLSAMAGVVCGVAAAGIIAYVVMEASSMTGLSTNEAQMIRFIKGGAGIDMKGLLFAGIVIGALGAVMDIGVELSSAMFEIKAADPGISASDHIKAGMRVGRDVIGTMTNTLILAYAGSSLPLMILFRAYGAGSEICLSMETVAAEVVRGLAGSVGLILSIPATVAAAALASPGPRRR